METYK